MESTKGMTFSEFNAAVQLAVFPDGQSENLVGPNRSYAIDALIDLQRKCPRLQINHTTVINPSETLFHCGCSLAEAPRGYIVGLYTMVPGDKCCQRVDYESASKDEMDCMIRDKEVCGSWCQPDVFPYGFYQAYTDGPYVAYPDLAYCAQYPTPEIDKFCRAMKGYFSWFRDKLWIFPSLQSSEVAILEWDGVKTDWQDSDILDTEIYTREVNELVELYVRSRSASIADCDLARGIFFSNENPRQPGMYQVRRADFIHSTNKERQLPKRNYCFSCA